MNETKPPGSDDPKDPRYGEYSEGRRILHPTAARQVVDALAAHRCIRLWRSHELGFTHLTAMTIGGKDADAPLSPHWKYGKDPEYVFTDASQFRVMDLETIARVKANDRNDLKRSDARKHGVNNTDILALQDGGTYLIVKCRGYINLEDWHAPDA